MFTAYQLGFGSGTGKAFVAFQTSAIDAVDRTVYTFSAQTFGAAASNRQIMIALRTGAAAVTVSSVTMGGISGVQIANVANTYLSEIWAASVPTGTTGDVVVTMSGGTQNCGIGVFRVVGAQTVVHATATSTADPMSNSLAIPSNGIAIGAGGATGSSAPTFTWTNLTEAFDETIESTAAQTGASTEQGTGATPTITCDPSVAASSQGLALASWAPV